MSIYSSCNICLILKWFGVFIYIKLVPFMALDPIVWYNIFDDTNVDLLVVSSWEGAWTQTTLEDGYPFAFYAQIWCMISICTLCSDMMYESMSMSYLGIQCLRNFKKIWITIQYDYSMKNMIMLWKSIIYRLWKTSEDN